MGWQRHLGNPKCSLAVVVCKSCEGLAVVLVTGVYFVGDVFLLVDFVDEASQKAK